MATVYDRIFQEDRKRQKDAEAALATARPAITEAMIEAACRAAVAAGNPQADADMQTPRRDGPGTETIWEAWRYLIEPALKAALDRNTIPAGYVVVPVELLVEARSGLVAHAGYVACGETIARLDRAAAPQSEEAE